MTVKYTIHYTNSGNKETYVYTFDEGVEPTFNEIDALKDEITYDTITNWVREDV
tara:strand:- start:2160 stop:2321 length:162 start_codon:yes stop_codon:yes gene_type:complete